MTFLMSVFFICFISETALAYMNIEEIRQRGGEGFVGKFGVDVTADSGNTETFLGKVSSLNDYKKENHEILLFGNYEYEESFEDKVDHWGNLHLRYARSFKNFPTVEYFIQGEFNEFTRTSFRVLTGPALRHKLFKKEETSLFLGTGAYFEREDIEDLGVERTVRGNLYLSYLYKLKRDIHASVTSYYQPSFDNMSDYWLSVDTGLEFKLNKFLSVGFEVQFFYDHHPPPRVETTDISYRTGFSISY